MTMTDSTPTSISTGLVVTAEMEGLVKQALVKVDAGTITLAQMIAAVAGDRLPDVQVTPEAPSLPAITDEQRAALQRVVEVYGKVSPTEARALSPVEQEALVEERTTIDAILKFLAARKEEGIREIIANHFDALIEEQGGDLPPKDDKGHYLVKQEQPVGSRKMQRIIAEGKPTITAEALARAEAEGIITHAEFLACTRMPEVPRILDESKMRDAIKKDPSLLFRLAGVTTPGKKTATIKVV